MDIVTINTGFDNTLLDTISEVNSTLASVQNKQAKSYKFWIGVRDILQLAQSHFHDIQHVCKRNELLEAENRFLKQWATDLRARLDVYEVVKAQLAGGSLEDTIKAIRGEA